MSCVRWAVYRNSFPFKVGEPLDTITAPTRAEAEQKARDIYGPNVLVQSHLSLEAAKREPAAPALKNVEKRRRQAGDR